MKALTQSYYLRSIATFSLLLAAITCHSQNVTPQRGDNVVIIATRDSLPVAFRKLQMTLQDNGYAIEKSDKEMYSLQTDNSPLKSSDISMYITGYIREMGGGLNYIYLQGKYNYVLSSAIVNVHNEGSGTASSTAGMNKVCFKQLETVAKSYVDGNVYYEKR